jgi:hypothetical protein
MKAKTTIAVIILAAGLTTTLVVRRERQIQLRSQSDFPRSAWKNAGYASPASALEIVF